MLLNLRIQKNKKILNAFVKIVLILLMLEYIASSLASANSGYPSIWNISNSNEFFIGRKLILDHISANFKQGKNILAIVGGAGMGKTQIAKKYSELHRQEYDLVWWIDADKSKNLNYQFKKFAEEINAQNYNKTDHINTFLSSDEIVKQLKEKLRTTNLKWLLVFDNASDMTKIKSYLPEKHNLDGYGHILITSKNPLPWSNIMILDKFTRDESIELLVKITQKSDLDATNNLAEALKDFPLALVQAATYIKSHPSITLDEYRELFLTNRARLWKEENNYVVNNVAFDNYQFTVFTTLSLIIKELEKQTDKSMQLLAFCSFLNNKDIPKSLLALYLNDIGVTDRLEQEQIITNLLQYSLMQLHETSSDYSVEHLSKDLTNGMNSTFTIHEITQLAMQEYLNKNQKQFYLKSAISTMVKFLPDKLSTLIPLIEKANFLLPHIQTLSNQAEKASIFNKDSLMLKIRELEYFLSGKRNFVYGNELIMQIEEKLPKILQDNLLLIRFYFMKAMYYVWNDFDFKSGIVETQKALILLDKLEGSHDEEYLMAYNRLIQFYVFSGDRKNALKYAKPGEDLINNAKGFLGNKDAFYHSLAKIYMDEEQFDKAYFYSTKAIENKSEPAGKIISGNLPCYILACEILIRNSKIDDAYKEITNLYKSTKDFIQDNDDIYMANIMIFYGYSSFLKNKNPKEPFGINMILEGQNMIKRLLGSKYYKNHGAAISHVFLGDIYQESRDYLKAQAEYNSAEEIFNHFYGFENLLSSDASDLYAKFSILYIKMDDIQAAQQYLSKLQKDFGYSHPKTLKVTNYFLESNLTIGY